MTRFYTHVAARFIRPLIVLLPMLAAGARTLRLSHFMARSLADLEGNLATVKSRYDGPVELATDLACFALARTTDR